MVLRTKRFLEHRARRWLPASTPTSAALPFARSSRLTPAPATKRLQQGRTLLQASGRPSSALQHGALQTRSRRLASLQLQPSSLSPSSLSSPEQPISRRWQRAIATRSPPPPRPPTRRALPSPAASPLPSPFECQTLLPFSLPTCHAHLPACHSRHIGRMYLQVVQKSLLAGAG